MCVYNINHVRWKMCDAFQPLSLNIPPRAIYTWRRQCISRANCWHKIWRYRMYIAHSNIELPIAAHNLMPKGQIVYRPKQCQSVVESEETPDQFGRRTSVEKHFDFMERYKEWRLWNVPHTVSRSLTLSRTLTFKSTLSRRNSTQPHTHRHQCPSCDRHAYFAECSFDIVLPCL